MEFYLKLANKEDDKKLKGITLFEDYNEEYFCHCCDPLVLGVGKEEYFHSSSEEYYLYYADKIEKIFKKISSILPNARLCFISAEDDGTGESDVMLKKENDNTIYHCSAFWEDFDIGSDEWCEQVIMQHYEELEEEEEMMRYINGEE